MADKKNAKNAKNYICKTCDFISKNKTDFNRHIETQKHKMLTNAYMDNRQIYKCECGKLYKQRQSLSRHKKRCKIILNETNEIKQSKMDKLDNKWIKMDKCPKMSKKEKMFICDCGKSYKYQSGLSKHKIRCNYIITESLAIIKNGNCDEEPDWKNMFIKLLEQNSELITQNDKIMNKTDELMNKNDEIVEKYTELAQKPTTINNNTQFNVMNYLNTDCKDAMNLTDFINDFTFSLKDLDLLQSKGYQEAMERTFVKQLCDMDKTKRPIHCSDKKRKSFYVKDNDVWEKDEDNKKLISSVQNLSNIHNKALTKWRSYNTDWSSNDKKQDFFNKSVQEFTKCDHEKERNKIFNKLSTLTIK
mgnify:CR=1 FL=1